MTNVNRRKGVKSCCCAEPFDGSSQTASFDTWDLKAITALYQERLSEESLSRIGRALYECALSDVHCPFGPRPY